MYEHTYYDEFFLMQDTVEIKDNSLFDRLFIDFLEHSVMISPKANSYLVKYCRNTLDKIKIPSAKNKREAVNYEWDFWNLLYFSQDSSVVLLPDLGPENVFEEKFGKMRQKLENKYLIKYKGTWLPEMIEQ